METREISRLADLILKRKQNNFNTHSNRKNICNNTSFDDRIKETQDKKGILDKNKRKLTSLFCGQIDERKPGNRSSGSCAELKRICKLIDTKNGYKWLSLSYIMNDIKNNFSCVSIQL